MTDIDFSRYPSKDYQLKWINEYLTHYHRNDSTLITDDSVYQLYADVNKFGLVAHFFWLLWAHIQAEHSEIDYDYLGYGVDSFVVYEIDLNQWLSPVIKFILFFFQLCESKIQWIPEETRSILIFMILLADKISQFAYDVVRFSVRIECESRVPMKIGFFTQRFGFDAVVQNDTMESTKIWLVQRYLFVYRKYLPKWYIAVRFEIINKQKHSIWIV